MLAVINATDCMLLCATAVAVKCLIAAVQGAFPVINAIHLHIIAR
jgi:hypothetical protein